MWGSDNHNDYLGHAVARSFGLTNTVQPRRLSHFESAWSGSPDPNISIESETSAITQSDMRHMPPTHTPSVEVRAGVGENSAPDKRRLSIDPPIGIKVEPHNFAHGPQQQRMSVDPHISSKINSSFNTLFHTPSETLESEHLETQAEAETSMMNVVPNIYSHGQREMQEQATEPQPQIRPLDEYDTVWQVEKTLANQRIQTHSPSETVGEVPNTDGFELFHTSPETHELEQFETQTATETSAMNVMPSTHSRQLRKAHEQIAESRSRIHPPGTHDAAWQVEEIPDLAPYPTPSSQIHIGLQQHANARFSQPHAQDVRYEPQELATIRTTLGMPERPMQKTHLVSESIDEALTEENFEGIQASQWQPSAWALAEVEQTASSISPSHNPKPFLAQPLHQSDVVPHGKRQQARAARAMNARPQAVLSASAPHGQPNSVARNGMTNITSMTPTIHVTIGRVEVRATSPPISSARKPAETKTGPSLDDYLRARNSGGQGGNP